MLYKIIVVITFILVAVSAVTEILFPAHLLALVGIESNLQTDFLLRTTAIALISFLPNLQQLIHDSDSTTSKRTLLGIAIYMFLSSSVDYFAFTQSIVNQYSIPSIIFRIAVGSILFYFACRKSSK